jgi:hypothetical protein
MNSEWAEFEARRSAGNDVQQESAQRTLCLFPAPAGDPLAGEIQN